MIRERGAARLMSPLSDIAAPTPLVFGNLLVLDGSGDRLDSTLKLRDFGSAL